MSADCVGEVPVITRRHFFRGMAAVAAGICIGNEIVQNHDLATDPSALRLTIEDNISSTDDQAGEDEWTYRDTVGLEAKGLLAEVGSVLTAHALGLDVGNADSDELKRRAAERPIDTGVQMALVSPLAEELVFRFIPSTAADLLDPASKGDRRWILGTATSALFAAAHNVGLQDKKIPLPQFVGGFFSWYLQRRAGLTQAAAGHITHNAAIYSIILVGGRRLN